MVAPMFQWLNGENSLILEIMHYCSFMRPWFYGRAFNPCNITMTSYGVSNHQPRHYLLNRLFRHRSMETSKLCVTSLWAGNSPGTGEFPAQMDSYAEIFPLDDVIMSLHALHQWYRFDYTCIKCSYLPRYRDVYDNEGMAVLSIVHLHCSVLNTLRPKQSGNCFADDIFKCIFVYEIYHFNVPLDPSFGPDNDLSPTRRQAIIWINDD